MLMNTENYFKFKDLPIISRGDYEGLPCPMYASEFDDEKMEELARLIYQELNSNYRYTDKELETYFNNGNRNECENTDASFWEDLDMAFWKEMEEIAVQMNMRYYEDMSEEEYNSIINQTN